MQTFLPYDNFSESARVLDRLRLGKQRVEAWQILLILKGERTSSAWEHHPAVLMWRGHEMALANYGVAMCLEWRTRGYSDTLLDRFFDYLRAGPPDQQVRIPWLTVDFCLAHRSNLIRKNPAYYGPKWPGVPMTMPYIWPVRIDDVVLETIRSSADLMWQTSRLRWPRTCMRCS